MDQNIKLEIPTIAVDFFLSLSCVVVWSPEVPRYCSSKCFSVFYVVCVVNVSPVQAVDLNFCVFAWDVIVPGE